MLDSPESTGVYRCTCGNEEAFVGVDAHGWGGDEACEVDHGEDWCSCDTVLVQPFTVVVNGDGSDPLSAAIDYDTFDGGGSGAEIGTYCTIICDGCGAIVWENESADDRLVGRAVADARFPQRSEG